MSTHRASTPVTPPRGPGADGVPGGPQVPRVGGVAGGVGTTTVAALLQATDAGIITAQITTPVQVLVCRSTAASVQAAVTLAAGLPLSPVLVVVADCGDRPPSTVRHRLRMAEPNLAAIVRVPWWPSLREADDPATRVRTVAWGEAAPTRSERSLPGVLDALVTAVTPLVTAPQARAQPPPEAENTPTAFSHVS